MCKALEDMREEARKEGMISQAKKSAFNMYEDGATPDYIAKMLGCAAEEVKKWLGLLPA